MSKFNEESAWESMFPERAAQNKKRAEEELKNGKDVEWSLPCTCSQCAIDNKKKEQEDEQ